DRLVYEDPENKEIGFFPFITEDGRYLGLYVYHGTDDRNGFYYREVESDGEFVRLLVVERARFSPIGNQGTTFFFNTDWKAPRGRILAIDLARPDEKNWKEIVPEQEDVISSVDMVNDHLVVQYMHNAHELMKVHDTKGKFVRDIPMPTIGSIGGVSGRQKGSEMFFLFTSFLYPTSIYRYDFTTDKVELFRSSEIAFDPSGYETRQVFFTSKDGTRVPMFLTHRKGLPMNGDNPVLLYGYGGFNINMSPFFSVSRLVWIVYGGVFAVANLGGGNEFGEEWHQGGMLDRKQNVFDDFIAAAEWLIRKKYTRKEKLAINGGSNGGLLVTACLIQRPDLFGAVVAQVPVTDMLRYHQWTVGRYWVPEYGNAEENPEDFKFLYAYSPLHNLEEGVAYHPTLVTTADTDDRVVPAHGKKFVATLQAADLGKNPILLRVEIKAGHGAGKPTSKIIEEQSDIYAFLFQTLGIQADPEVRSSK
ncbi:MAG: prolyl oligopeptidase family serine peptidase, partial [Acidobacteriota bacterium]